MAAPCTIAQPAPRRSVEQVRTGSGGIGRGLLLLDNIIAANVHRTHRCCRRGAQLRLGLGPSQPDPVGLKFESATKERLSWSGS